MQVSATSYSFGHHTYSECQCFRRRKVGDAGALWRLQLGSRYREGSLSSQTGKSVAERGAELPSAKELASALRARVRRIWRPPPPAEARKADPWRTLLATAGLADGASNGTPTQLFAGMEEMLICTPGDSDGALAFNRGSLRPAADSRAILGSAQTAAMGRAGCEPGDLSTPCRGRAGCVHISFRYGFRIRRNVRSEAVALERRGCGGGDPKWSFNHGAAAQIAKSSDECRILRQIHRFATSGARPNMLRNSEGSLRSPPAGLRAGDSSAIFRGRPAIRRRKVRFSPGPASSRHGVPSRCICHI